MSPAPVLRRHQHDETGHVVAGRAVSAAEGATCVDPGRMNAQGSEHSIDVVSDAGFTCSGMPHLRRVVHRSGDQSRRRCFEDKELMVTEDDVSAPGRGRDRGPDRLRCRSRAGGDEFQETDETRSLEHLPAVQPEGTRYCIVVDLATFIHVSTPRRQLATRGPVVKRKASNLSAALNARTFRRRSRPVWPICSLAAGGTGQLPPCMRIVRYMQPIRLGSGLVAGGRRVIGTRAPDRPPTPSTASSPGSTGSCLLRQRTPARHARGRRFRAGQPYEALAMRRFGAWGQPASDGDLGRAQSWAFPGTRQAKVSCHKC